MACHEQALGGRLCAQQTYEVLQCQPPILYGKYNDAIGNPHETVFDEEAGWNSWVEKSLGPASHYFSHSTTVWCAPTVNHRYGQEYSESNPLHTEWDEHWEHAWQQLGNLYVACGRNPPNMC